MPIRSYSICHYVLTCMALIMVISVSGVTQAQRVIFEEDFESAGKEVSCGKVSGRLASKHLTENSSWTGSTIIYTPIRGKARQGKVSQRVEMKSGHQLQLMKYGVKGEPGQYMLLKISFKGKPGTPVSMGLSNTSKPKSGPPYQVHWSTELTMTKDWVDYTFILPDVKVADELRLSIVLREPGMFQIDQYGLYAISPREAIKSLRANIEPVSFAKQQRDGVATPRQIKANPEPWPGKYKLKKEDRRQLTAADIIGPDGLVYPDWRYAGIKGGIPEVRVKAHAEKFGAYPDDNKDDSQAILKALQHVGEKGGGAVLLKPGVYHLDQPITILWDKVVLRGAGMDKTRLVFRYAVPSSKVKIVSHRQGETIGYHDQIEAHADPEHLERLELWLNDSKLREWKINEHSIGTFWVRAQLFTAMYQGAKVANGNATLKAVAYWKEGKKSEQKIRVKIDLNQRKENGQIRFTSTPAAIAFAGDFWTFRGRRWPLAKDLKRGEKVVEFKTNPPLKAGDHLMISVPTHQDFIERVRSARKDIPRNGYFIVKSVKGKRVVLNQPARIDYPASQGARGETLHPIRHSGIEDLTLEQTEKLWFHGIHIARGYQCWIKSVRVNKAGRNPIDIGGSKNTEVRDSEFNDAWYLGGGGTGYISFSNTHDCLMENITTRRLRHAPNAQWGAQGNVFRNSTFIQSDAQFHMGWAVENLYENLIVDAAKGSGSYGYGLYVQKPEVSIHGPGGGPRNVMYYNDFKSPRSGVFLGGSNEAWYFLHNRFIVASGPGFEIGEGAFDLVIQGNAIQLMSPVAEAFRIKGQRSPGIELMNNRLQGASEILFTGESIPLLWRGNRWIKSKSEIDRPQPSVKSIFEWQRR